MDINKIRELIARTPTVLDSAMRWELENDIEKGRGGLYLQVTTEQYLKLKGVDAGPVRR